MSVLRSVAFPFSSPKENRNPLLNTQLEIIVRFVTSSQVVFVTSILKTGHTSPPADRANSHESPYPKSLPPALLVNAE
jgi:hypothetical protein